MLINNNINFGNNISKQKTNKSVKYSEKTVFSNKPVVATTSVLGLGAIAVGFINKKSIGKNFNKLIKQVKNIFTKPKPVKQVDVSSCKGIDMELVAKTRFLNDFVEGVKKPFETTVVNGIEKKELRYIPNGLMLTGPDSKAKVDRFNWMLSELEKAGAEIIDPGHGKNVKFKEVDDAWWKMWKSNDDEKFKKTGKYRVFVVRGADELGPPPGYSEGEIKFPDGCILKDSPDSNASRERHGIMLFYTCKNPSKMDPAVIRTGRIDRTYNVRPYDDEPLDTWKEYLDNMKWSSPPLVVRKLEEAKEVLSKRGEDVMKEMEPHLQYSVPYEIPKATESLDKWQEYVAKTSENVDRAKCNKELMYALKSIDTGLQDGEGKRKKLNAVIKMTEDIQKPEDLATWRDMMRFELAGDGGYAYAGKEKITNNEYVERMLREYGVENHFINSKVDKIKDIKRGSEPNNINNKE